MIDKLNKSKVIRLKLIFIGIFCNPFFDPNVQKPKLPYHFVVDVDFLFYLNSSLWPFKFHFLVYLSL